MPKRDDDLTLSRVVLTIPAVMCASMIIPSVFAGLGLMLADRLLGGPLSRAAESWVDGDERRKFRNSDLYDNTEPWPDGREAEGNE